MKITSNYNTPYSMSKCRKPCFQANLMPELQKTLIQQAKQSGQLGKLKAQVNNLKRWGDRDSSIDTCLDLDTLVQSLTISNPRISNLYNGDLSVNPKETLLDQFFSLTKKNILNGERDIRRAVINDQSEAVDKILNNPQAIKELTGKVNPTEEELGHAISKLTEEQLLSYRYPADENVVGTGDGLLEAFKLAN